MPGGRGVAALITLRVLEYEDEIVHHTPGGVTDTAPHTGSTATARAGRPPAGRQARR
jgi:hypothetical protein